MAELKLEELNARVLESPEGLIREAEERYRALISDIAEHITENADIKIVLLAGPSGSGKTTSANLIADAATHRGRHAIVVSLDDFYRNTDDPDYPRTANGERDCESPDALDIPELVKTLSSVARGESFTLPKYDFKTCMRTAVREHTPMKNGIVIIEGLHALNPKIFSLLPEKNLYKIFISVSTNITQNGSVILSGRKIRFVRRMTRDSIYRNASAEKTLSMWMNVLKGEDEHLYPNRIYADVSFDTFHQFELSVMREFVEKLISDELAQRDPYAKTVKSALVAVEPIPHDVIPQSSLIREFIPGGIYESLY